MKIIEAMARAMCQSAAIDPDTKTIAGVLTQGVSDGEVFSLLREDEDPVPAWVRFKAQAKVAYAAYTEAVKSTEIE